MAKQQTLVIEGTEIRASDYYISITDIALSSRLAKLVRNWLRARSTVDFLGA